MAIFVFHLLFIIVFLNGFVHVAVLFHCMFFPCHVQFSFLFVYFFTSLMSAVCVCVSSFLMLISSLFSCVCVCELVQIDVLWISMFVNISSYCVLLAATGVYYCTLLLLLILLWLL